MQKIGILNSHIAKVLSDLGHTDQITIGDCGLPVPDNVLKIAKYMQVERIYVAKEMEIQNPTQWKALHSVFPVTEVEWVVLSEHEEFKKMTKQSKAIIRTGEITPFSNVIFESGVIF